MNFVSAAAGATLVIVGVAAMYFAQRRRDYEFAALRAMGAAPGRSSGRSRSSSSSCWDSRSWPASASATCSSDS